MRKYYFLLSALLLQCFSFGAFAQTSSAFVQGLGDPLITDVSQLSSNASDESEGTDLGVLIDGSVSTFWHSDWHGKVKDPHYLQVELMNSVQDGYIVMYLQRRDNSDTDCHLTKAKLSASEDGETWEDLAEWELGNAEAKAEVLSEPCPISKPYLYFRVTNNAASPIYFHTAEFELYNPSMSDLVVNILDKILAKYDIYYYGGYEVLKVGTELGQFSDTETADKILDALEKVDSWVAEPEASEDFPSSMEEANAFSDKVDSLFTAFWKSEILYQLPADGYYRIIANLPYKQSVETGDVDDDNNPITETTYVNKAIFSSVDYKGMWGTLKEDMANYVWKLTQNSDSTIDMFNVGMEASFSVVESGNVRLDPAGNVKMAFDYAGTNEDGKTVVYIRAASWERSSEGYFHQLNHNKGTQVEDNPLTTWKGTFDMGSPYDSDKGTSEWYLEPVSEEEVAELIEAFEPVKNHDKLVASNAALRTTVAEAIETAKDKTRIPLVTSGDQMTSPFSQNDFGSEDGGYLANGVLIDGDPATFWHSVWSVGSVEVGSHYIQISGMEGMTGDTKIYVKRRATADNHPTEFTLKGSNDPEAEDSLWTTITVQALGNVYSGGEFTTPTFDAGDTPYSYVRVYASKNGIWHSAELQIYRLEDNPNSQFAALGELATNLEALYNENVATEDADITYAMYEALMEAYEAFKAGIVDPTDLRNIIANYIGYTKGMVEGTNPGQWSDLTAYETFNNLYKEISDYNDAGRYTKAKIDYYKAAIQLAADNYLSSANKPKTDTWYNIKFAPEELYDATGWTKNNVIDVAGSSVATPVFDNYVTIAKFDKIEDSEQYDYYPAPEEDIREGVTFCALDEAMLEERPEAAMFRFVELNHSLPVIDDLNKLKNRSQLALEMSATYSVGDALITKASQLSSNASDEQEGKYMESLIDNDVATFWHSDWHGKVNDAPHYLQVSFDTPVSGAIKVNVSRRSNTTNGDITRMYITGSNDGETWENVGYVELPFSRTGESISSTPVYVDGEYTNLRFIMTARNSDDTEYDPFGNVGKYFHLSEFQIYPVTVTGESETAKALQAALAEANKVVFKDFTVADFTALAEAYNALQAEINAGEHKVVPASPAKVTRFALQNRATGLFVNAKAKNNADVTMELMPSFVEPAAIGYGENTLRVDNFDGTYCSYLHIQKTNHQLVTWNDNSVGSNSGLMIEEVESSNEQTDFAFTKDLQYGEINAWCYPVDLITSETEGKVYSVAGIYTGEDQTVYLALDEAEKVKAGQPVLYINGAPEDYVEGTEEVPAVKDPIIFTISTTFNFEEGVDNGLIGTLKSTKVNSGVCTFEKNLIKTVEDEAGATVAANSAYLDFDACAKVDSEHALNIVLDDPTGIQNTLVNVSKSGNIYTADGKLVRANGTLNDMKGLGTGIYIINGVKVLVK